MWRNTSTAWGCFVEIMDKEYACLYVPACRRAVCMLNATSVYVPRRYSGWELRITNVGLSLRLTKFQ